MGVPTTGLGVARSLTALGQLVEARDAAVLVTRRPSQPNESAPFVRARAAAEQLARDLAARIPSVQITVTGPAEGAEIRATLDKEPIPQAVLKLPVKTDPGNQVVQASAAGFDGASKTFAVQEGENAIVVVPLEATPRTANTGAAPHPAIPDAAPAPRERHPLSPLVYAGFAAGAAGLLTGTIAGIARLNKIASIKSDYCDGTTACREGFQGAIDDARPTATISDVGFAVAGAGVATGVIGLFVSKGSKAEPTRFETGALPWRPTLGIQSVGVDFQF